LIGERFPNRRPLIGYRTEVVHDRLVEVFRALRRSEKWKFGRSENLERHIVMGILKDAAKVTSRDGVELIADRADVLPGSGRQI
jgi:hypothetical protein